MSPNVACAGARRCWPRGRALAVVHVAHDGHVLGPTFQGRKLHPPRERDQGVGVAVEPVVGDGPSCHGEEGDPGHGLEVPPDRLVGRARDAGHGKARGQDRAAPRGPGQALEPELEVRMVARDDLLGRGAGGLHPMRPLRIPERRSRVVAAVDPPGPPLAAFRGVEQEERVGDGVDREQHPDRVGMVEYRGGLQWLHASGLRRLAFSRKNGTSQRVPAARRCAGHQRAPSQVVEENPSPRCASGGVS